MGFLKTIWKKLISNITEFKDSQVIKIATGRPSIPHKPTQIKYQEIRLKFDTLFHFSTYINEKGEIKCQYRHYDSRTKDDLPKDEIYYTILEEYPELTSVDTIKDIINKKTHSTIS